MFNLKIISIKDFKNYILVKLSVTCIYPFCNIGPNVLCCKERSPQKKKYSNSKVREENKAVVYYSLRAMIVATRKVHFSYILLLPSSWWCRRCG